MKRATPDVTLTPGRVVIGNVIAPREGKTDGKPRPVVLVGPRLTPDQRPAWAVMGLTTKSTYEDGHPRFPIADWRRMGLRQPGYLWGGRLAVLPLEDIYDPIGWVGVEDARQIREFADGDEGIDFAVAVALRETS